jgi:hypothetical protein
MKLVKNLVVFALLTISMHANAQTSPIKSGASAAQEPVSKPTKNTGRSDVGGGIGGTKGTGSAGRSDVGGGTGGTKGTGSAGRTSKKED